MVILFLILVNMIYQVDDIILVWNFSYVCAKDLDICIKKRLQSAISGWKFLVWKTDLSVTSSFRFVLIFLNITLTLSIIFWYKSSNSLSIWVISSYWFNIIGIITACILDTISKLILSKEKPHFNKFASLSSIHLFNINNLYHTLFVVVYLFLFREFFTQLYCFIIKKFDTFNKFHATIKLFLKTVKNLLFIKTRV